MASSLTGRRWAPRASRPNSDGPALRAHLDSDFAGSTIRGDGQWRLEGDYPGSATVRFSKVDLAQLEKWACPPPKVAGRSSPDRRKASCASTAPRSGRGRSRPNCASRVRDRVPPPDQGCPRAFALRNSGPWSSPWPTRWSPWTARGWWGLRPISASPARCRWSRRTALDLRASRAHRPGVGARPSTSDLTASGS